MESNYGYILENAAQLVQSVQNPLKKFNKQDYPSQLEKYSYEHEQLIEAIKSYFNEKNEGEIKEFANVFAFSLVSPIQYAQESVSKKTIRDKNQIDLNLVLVIYVFPLLQDKLGENGKILSEAVIEEWKKAFPKESNIQLSTKESIQRGFKSRLCYISTASALVNGMDDHCYELELLRDFRDRFLSFGNEQSRQMSAYYNVSPTILKRIDRSDNSQSIYRSLWKEYILPCIRYIESKDEESCYQHYMKMVQSLKETYLYGYRQEEK